MYLKSSIRTDLEGEAVEPESQTVPHVGPVEGKVLKGADGRLYALEFVRTTPRDANFVSAAEGGTGNIPQDELELGDASLRSVYLLRRELITMFIQVDRTGLSVVVFC